MFAYSLGFHTCRLSTVYTEVISLAFPKYIRSGRMGLWGGVPGLSSTNEYPYGFFGLLVISIHKVHSILVKHAFCNNSDMFSIARTSE